MNYVTLDTIKKALVPVLQIMRGPISPELMSLGVLT